MGYNIFMTELKRIQEAIINILTQYAKPIRVNGVICDTLAIGIDRQGKKQFNDELQKSLQRFVFTEKGLEIPEELK